MLISLLALVAMTISAALRVALADVPIILEGPATLELALIGGGVIVVYAVAARKLRQRRARIESMSAAVPLATPAQNATVEQPSRGAA